MAYTPVREISKQTTLIPGSDKYPDGRKPGFCDRARGRDVKLLKIEHPEKSISEEGIYKPRLEKQTEGVYAKEKGNSKWKCPINTKYLRIVSKHCDWSKVMKDFFF